MRAPTAVGTLPRLRVVHVLPSLALRAGGPAVYVAEAAAAMESARVESRVITTDLRGPPTVRRRPGVTVDEFPPAATVLNVALARVRTPRRFAYAPGMVGLLQSAVRSADLVIIHSLFLYPQFAAWRTASRAGVPYVVAPHGALDPYLRRRGRLRKALTDVLWQRRMLADAAAFQFATAEEAELVADVAPHVPRIIVPLGVHAAAFRELPSPQAFRDAQLDGHDGPVVLTLGRLARKKGLDILIRAFARVSATHPDTLLVLAGPDDEGLEPGLRALADDLGIGERVVFTGMLFHEQRLQALASATVWALPSHTENFAIAAMEALAAGVPVIVSPAVNLAPRLLARGAALVADPTPEAFGRSLAELLSSSEQRDQLAAAGRSFAEEYEWGLVAAETTRIYEELLGLAVPPHALETTVVG